MRQSLRSKINHIWRPECLKTIEEVSEEIKWTEENICASKEELDKDQDSDQKMFRARVNRLREKFE